MQPDPRERILVGSTALDRLGPRQAFLYGAISPTWIGTDCLRGNLALSQDGWGGT